MPPPHSQDDSCDLRTRLRRAKVQGSLTVYRTLPHAWFALRGVLPDASQAVDDAFAKIGEVLAGGATCADAPSR